MKVRVIKTVTGYELKENGDKRQRRVFTPFEKQHMVIDEGTGIASRFATRSYRFKEGSRKAGNEEGSYQALEMTCSLFFFCLHSLYRWIHKP